MSHTVAVFFGGRSNEREISVITGMLAVNLLRGADFKVIPVYLTPEGEWVTGAFRSPSQFKKGVKRKQIAVQAAERSLVRRGTKRVYAKIDCALNCCHGGAGEDGTLSAVLSLYHIPLASPDVPMSAIFMDKTISKYAAKGLDIPVAPFFLIDENAWKDRRAVLEKAQRFGYPIIVKPARLGSSIGIRVAQGEEELAAALELAFTLDGKVLAERYFKEKRDINCAAVRLNQKTVLSPLEEVFSDEAILTFSEKYEGTGARKSQLPADLPRDIAEKIGDYTRTLYEIFGGRGVVRADFLVVGSDVYFNELNTVPGSLACYLFGSTLSKNRDFLRAIVEETLSASEEQKKTLTSGILEGALFSGAKGTKRG